MSNAHRKYTDACIMPHRKPESVTKYRHSNCDTETISILYIIGIRLIKI